jgi:hypothetical protein
MRSSRIASVLALVALLCTAPARADVRSFELEWIAPAECPPASAVEEAALRLIGEEPSLAAPIRVRATVVRGSDALHLDVSTWVNGDEGARTFEAASCDAIVQMAALVIAMIVDASASETAPEAVVEATEPAPEPEPVTEPVPVAPPSDPGPSFVAAAHAAIGVGPLPSASPGAALWVGARISFVEIWARGAFLAEQERGGGAFGMASGALGAGLAFDLGTPIVELAPHLSVEMGSVWGRGISVPNPRTAYATWIAIVPGLEARAWIVESFGISIFADLAIPLLIPNFEVAQPGGPLLVHASSPASFFGGIGAIVRAR